MHILGIETSCDETAVAVVDDKRQIHDNIVISQLKHSQYGGVVPEVAARAHLELLDTVLARLTTPMSQVDAIAATCGPGLIGGVMVGATCAKAIAYGLGKPFIAVNHLAAHALTARLDPGVEFPYLLFLLSGGHSQIIIVRGINDYQVLGSTIDDAFGEAFDKTAKMLGLGYPGGPIIEELARKGNPDAFVLPRPLVAGRDNKKHKLNFSLSGLKTAIRSVIQKQGPELSLAIKQDIAASAQKTIADILVNRARNALQYCQDHNIDVNKLVIAGGVAANQYIKVRLEDAKLAIGIVVPPMGLCTDNGAMIAWAGLEQYRLGLTDSLNFRPIPRWPLTSSI